jgi:hypothetical protein
MARGNAASIDRRTASSNAAAIEHGSLLNSWPPDLL